MDMEHQRFEGKTVLVTGAGGSGAYARSAEAMKARRGTGRAISLRFAQEGADIVAVDLRKEALDETLDLIKQAGGRAIGVQGSVASADEVEDLFAAAEAEFGSVDVLVNNAGIDDGFQGVLETDPNAWHRIHEVNLTGPYLTSRRALPAMIASGRGVIVNIVSVAGTSGGATGVAYTASKHGLVGLTKSIAVAYGGQGIRCVGVSPGLIRNEVTCEGPEIAARSRAQGRIGQSHGVNFRSGTPEEIAAVVCFLASEEAGFVNGAVLAADGGWTAF
jgi:NAD(P)-dependent dehydrogenase (short-subunit alcohol dehydrogenase family)